MVGLHSQTVISCFQVLMEKVVPNLQDGAIASHLGLPDYYDFIFYAIIMVLCCGSACNALSTHFSKQPCFGIDPVVAAAAGYRTAFSYSSRVDPSSYSYMAPQVLLWTYLPLTAVLGGSYVAWLLGGMFGVMLGQYHLDNQSLMRAFRRTIESFLN